MNIIEIILGIIVLCIVGSVITYIFNFCINFWVFAESICSFIEIIIDFISYPFKQLWKFIKEKLNFSKYLRPSAIDRFANRHPNLGTGKSIKFFLFAIIFHIAVITVLVNTDQIEDFFSEAIFTFPFFFIIDLLSNKVPFDIVSFISTGLTSMLIAVFFELFSDEYKGKGSFGRWMASLGYYIVTASVACSISVLLKNVLEMLAKSGISIYDSLKGVISASEKTFWGVAVTVLCVIALIAILYVGIILITITVKEYIETFCYGGLGFVFAIVIIISLTLIFGTKIFDTTWGQIIVAIICLIGIFGFDFLRVNKKVILELDDDESD